MPPVGEVLDDDYVISLLKKDADANQKRYLTGGLGSLLSKRPRGNAPKPNTRFLKNIIRETDNHNAALKAREEEESKAKLRELRKEQIGRKRAHGADSRDDGSSKRRRGEDKPGRWTNVLGGLGKDPSKSHKASKDEEASRDRERILRDARDHDERRHKRHNDRSHRNSRSRSPSHRKERKRRRSSVSRPRSRSLTPVRSKVPLNDDIEDSDPLEGIIGLKPASEIRTRGRGAAKPSAMDSRFDPKYDPREDVDLEPNDDHDDWDMALEALRDRAKWRTRGADRLRAAGFTDDEVKKWERGGEKDIADVRWSKKGEGREWDRGKVVSGDGDVNVKADWGRLKET